MKRSFTFLAFLSFTCLVAQPSSIPDWLITEWSHLTKPAVWVTSNKAYQREQEPFEAYGLQWKWGLGKKSITGKLFGIQDGKLVGTFWEFRIYWHPLEQRAVAEQFGENGVVGLGTIAEAEGDTLKMIQTFYNPDGTQFATGHKNVTTAKTHFTKSFSIDSTGNWIPSRQYTWQPAAPDEAGHEWLSEDFWKQLESL